MFGGLNWIDGVIILLLVAAIAGSLRVGFFRQTFVIIGFFGALILGGWLFPHILPIEDRTLKTVINVNLVLITATYAAVKSFELGERFHKSLRKGKFGQVESGLGVVPGLAAALVVIWLLAAMVGRLPFAGFSNSANDAVIVQVLGHTLPEVPAVFAAFNHQVDPNSPPELFVAKPEPEPLFNFSPTDAESAAAKAAPSVVRITGFGCGGIEGGSGFVVAKDLVATNAHVIAGTKRPIVKYDNHSYEAVPVLFNSRLDIAILKVLTPVHAFAAPPLALAAKNVGPGTTVSVLGYPGGNYAATPGIIRNDLVVYGRNIYDLGTIARNIYAVQTNVKQGSSGGPIVLADGKVAGIVFAKNDAVENYAIALTSPQLLDQVQQAKESQKRVSTGVCLAD